VVKTEKTAIAGCPDRQTIGTSHIEKQNHTVGAHENCPTCAHEKGTFRWEGLSLSK